MTALRVLTELEYSRHSLAKRGMTNSILIALFLFFLLLFGGLYVMRNNPSPRTPLIAGSLLIWIVAMSISGIHMLLMPGQPHREWILTFPHPRITLLYAKAISLMKLGINYSLLIIAAGIAEYSISIRLGHYEPLPLGDLLYLVTAYLTFAASILPVAIVCGLLIGIMQWGKTILLAIPYTLFWMAPIFLFAYVNDPSHDIYILRYTSPSFVMLYALVFIIIGWPVCYLLMQWIARAGLGEMGGIRNTFKPSFTADSYIKEKKGQSGHPSGFVALYQLDAGRLRQIEKLHAIQIIKWVIPVVVAVTFYFASNELQALLPAMKGLFTLPVLFGTLWMMSRNSIDRRHMPWLLSFPQSRIRLLLSNIAAVWVTVMRVNAVLGASAVVGLGVSLGLGREDLQGISRFLSWLFFSFLTYTLVLTLLLCLLQISYYFMKSKVLLFFIFPLAFPVAFQNIIINKYMFPENLRSGMLPSWDLLGWIALIGLPLTISCIPLGAKYFHLALIANQTTTEKTKQA